MKVKIKILFAIILLSACTSSKPEQEYIEWVKGYENGLHVIKKSGEFYFDVQYQPHNYLNLIRGQSNSKIATNPNYIEQYKLRIGMDGQQDILTYEVQNELERQQKEYYFSYRFQNDIYLVKEGKKIPCQLFQFEKSNKIKNTITFTLGFPTTDVDSNSTLVIDSDFFSYLPIKIKIQNSNIPESIIL